MRYSEMTVHQQRALLDDPEVFPLRVVFLGKAAILTAEEVDFLRHNGVDFEVDERQAEKILATAAREDVSVLWSGPTPASTVENSELPSAWLGLLARIAGIFAGLWLVLRLASRLLRR